MNNEENINIYAVYTVITGKKDLYDKIHEQDKKFKESTIDYYLFTDNKTVKNSFFKVVYIQSLMPSKILSRDIKIQVHKYLPNYKKTLYIDGNVKIINFLSPLFNNMTADIETYYINRNLIEESEWIIKRNYCSEEILANKLNKYKNEGLDIENTKTKYGKILLRKKLVKMEKFQKAWFEEYLDILRDQLSLPYCLWKFRIKHRNLGKTYRCKHFEEYFNHLGKHEMITPNKDEPLKK